MSFPKPTVVPAAGRHTATVIVCHGLGDSGAGWTFLSDLARRAKKLEQVKFIFPNAPTIPVTLNRGMRMSAWFDLNSLVNVDKGEDEARILESKSYLHSLVKQEVAAGIAPARIVLGGFSQGGAVALTAGLTYPEKLAGIFVLSAFAPMRSKFQSMVTVSGDANAKTLIFMGHGDKDPMVRYEFGKGSADLLKEWGYNVDFHTYPGLQHSAAPEELADLQQYLDQALPPLPGSPGKL